VAAEDAEPSFANSPFADAEVEPEADAEVAPTEGTEAVAEDAAESDLQAEDEWAEEADDAGTLAAVLQDKPAPVEPEDDGPKLSDEEENHRYLKGLIEALLFSSEKPLSLRELARAARLDKKRATDLLKEVTRDYRKRGMHVVEIAGGYGFRSSPVYAPYVQKLLSLRPVRLSRAQLETLAVIAYRQPVTRPEVDDVRGVDSGQVIKGLLDRDLIKMMGKKDEVGRPMLYGTTPAFLELFSLESLKDLPNLREFTELSDASREKFKDAMGENAPGGSELDAADLADESDSEPVALGDFEDGASDPAASEAEPSDPAASEVEASDADADEQPTEVEPTVEEELDAPVASESDSVGV
jgi:segregation and condensation protein B